MVKTIDPVYIKTLRNRSTNTTQKDVPTVLDYLFTTYRTIELEILRERKLKVCEMAYDLVDLLVTIYDETKELENLGDTVVNLYLQSQTVNYGLTMIKNMNNFETGIRTWITRPAIEYMWTNFKTYFEEAHRVLRLVRGITIQSSAYHHANVLASQALLEAKNVQDNVLQAFETHTAQIKMETEEVTPPHKPRLLKQPRQTRYNRRCYA